MTTVLRLLAGAACTLMALAAQAWPDKPVKLVVPYAAGGTADALARVVASELGTRLKQQVLVENRPGAGGVIGAQAVLQAPADGYTFLYDSSNFAINPGLFAQLPLDYKRDFAPVGLVARIPTLLVVAAGSPVQSVADLVQRARAKPGAVSYGSAGNGGAAHLSGELFQQGFKLDLIHVPYKGGAPALTDLAGGQIDFMFSALTSSGPLVKAGKLRAIAATSERRLDAMPQVPTVAESGLSGFTAYEWNALWAPAKTPEAIVRQMERTLHEALAQPAVRQRFAELGASPGAGDAKELATYAYAEMAKWAQVIKAANIKPD